MICPANVPFSMKRTVELSSSRFAVPSDSGTPSTLPALASIFPEFVIFPVNRNVPCPKLLNGVPTYILPENSSTPFVSATSYVL